MIVDVTDLKIRTLGFNRPYDINRYNRGRKIYNREEVRVKQVDKKGEKQYEVEAWVEGTHGIYSVKMKINGNVIEEATCNCEDYRNGNLCKHIMATSMEVIDPHYASTKEGKEQLRKLQEEEEAKRWQEFQKRKERERKEREYREKYSDALRTIDLYKLEENHKESLHYFDLSRIYNEMQENKKKKQGDLATSLKLECRIEFADSEMLKVTFKIGQTRMYVLNDIPEFYEAYKNGTELYYGKQLRFIPKRELFNEESQKWFDYIIEYAKLLEYYEKMNSYTSFSSKELHIIGDKIDELFCIAKKEKIVIPHYYEDGEEYVLTDKDLEIKCILQKEKVEIYNNYFGSDKQKEESEEYVLRLNIEDYSVLFSNQYIYIFYQGKIYKKEKKEKLEKLFGIFRRHEYILIPEDKLGEFEEFVMSKVDVEAIKLPAEVRKEASIANTLASKILLDTNENGNILLELKFCYLDYEFNILDRNYEKYVIENNIVRDVPKEVAVIKRIFADGFQFEPDQRQFIMQKEENIYDFLVYKVEGYMKDFEVLATDKFKNKQIRQPKISNIGVKVDNGLLELDISKVNIDIGEIKDILKDYKVKKKYYKLKNGDFLDLEKSQELDLLDEMMVTLDVDYSKIENGVIELPVSRSIYLEKLVEGTDKNIKVTRNNEFKNIVDNIESTNSSVEMEIDKDFENVLRDYQKTGYRWLKTLERYQFGGILADDMGLRKNVTNHIFTEIRFEK